MALAACAVASGAPPHRWPKDPARWLRQAECIHRYETGLAAYSDSRAWRLRWHDRDNPASRGGFQFLYSTWASVGGMGDPAAASRSEQTYRAWLVWRRDGGSWREWTTARFCGLT